jgi:hypothetical protein
MDTLLFKSDDVVKFKYVEGHTIWEVKIDRVDPTDANLPYHGVTLDDSTGFWFSQADIVEKVSSNDQLDRIEAKLDAIIAHLNVPFETEN